MLIIQECLTILSNLTVSKDKNSFVVRKDIFKSDIFAIGSQLIDVIDQLVTIELSEKDYCMIEDISWFFACITYKLDDTKIADMKNG